VGRTRHDDRSAFVDGEWGESADGATFGSVSPIDNTVIAQVARGGRADADRAALSGGLVRTAS